MENFSCPKCNKQNIIPIVYGYPSDKLLSDASAGNVRLGGCVIFGDDPNYSCKDCGHTWLVKE